MAMPCKKCIKVGEWSRKIASDIEKLYKKNLKRMKKEKDSYFLIFILHFSF
jgi:hypothetical protein